MIPDFPKSSVISLNQKNQFDKLTKTYEPYAEFSFPCLYSWDTTEDTLVSVLNNNLVIRMPDYITMEPFYSLIGKTKIDDTLEQLFQSQTELKMVPEVVVGALENTKVYKIEEDRDQFDYVYLLEDQVQLLGKHFKGRRNKSSKFYRTYEDSLELRKIQFSSKKNRDQILATFRAWAHDRNKTKRDTEHEAVAIQRIMEAAPYFNLIGIQMFIDGKCVGFSINEVIDSDYAVCRFHKSLVESYSYIDAFFTNLVAIELQHFGCTYISWEQDLGIPGLREFKESYRPIKYLKKYTISKN